MSDKPQSNKTIWIIAAVIAISLTACLGRKDEPAPAPAPQPAPVVENAPPKQQEPPKQVELPKPPAELPFTVKVTGGRINKVAMTDKVRNRPGKSDKVMLEVYVKITNRSDTKIAYYDPWSGRLSGLASLQDEFGNRYSNITPTFGNVFDDQLTERTRIDPRASITDVIVFDPPLEAAKSLTFRLPVRNLGLIGDDIVTTMDRSFIIDN